MSREHITAEQIWVSVVQHWDEGCYFVPESNQRRVTFRLVEVGILKTNPVWSIFWPASWRVRNANRS